MTTSEMELMLNQEQTIIWQNIPYSILEEEMKTMDKVAWQQEMSEINKLYEAYKKGMSFYTEGSNGDYLPSRLRFKKAAGIINKEAGFLFGNPPTFTVNPNVVDEEEMEATSIIQDLLDEILKTNAFNDKLLKATKDCFIGKRIAVLINFHPETGVGITFLDSRSFLYEFAGKGSNKLSRFTAFFNIQENRIKEDQLWFKKAYTLEDGDVYLLEEMYNGLGILLKTIFPRQKIDLKFIPAFIVFNDGLTGEEKGESELGYILDYEAVFSKLNNADIDAMRKSMNPTRYAIDASNTSTKNLSTSPGSFWDIQSDREILDEGGSAKLGLLEPQLSYATAIDKTLNRLERAMYDAVDMPNTSNEAIRGMITSGKALHAMYWGLAVRCDTKMLSWEPCFDFISHTIVEGARIYTDVITLYTNQTMLPDIDYVIKIENNYPLPADEAEEKGIDMGEVAGQLMSRTSYMKKWREMTDDEIELELEKIKEENDLFENSEMLPETDMSDFEEGEEEGLGDEDETGIEIDEELERIMSVLEGI